MGSGVSHPVPRHYLFGSLAFAFPSLIGGVHAGIEVVLNVRPVLVDPV